MSDWIKLERYDKRDLPPDYPSNLIFLRAFVTRMDSSNEPVECKALFDTGCSYSWISISLAKQLGHELGEFEPVTFTTTTSKQQRCCFSLLLGEQRFSCCEGIAIDEGEQKRLTIFANVGIGLDVLEQCAIKLFGPDKEVWLKRILDRSPRPLGTRPSSNINWNC